MGSRQPLEWAGLVQQRRADVRSMSHYDRSSLSRTVPIAAQSALDQYAICGTLLPSRTAHLQLSDDRLIEILDAGVDTQSDKKPSIHTLLLQTLLSRLFPGQPGLFELASLPLLLRLPPLL